MHCPLLTTPIRPRARLTDGLSLVMMPGSSRPGGRPAPLRKAGTVKDMQTGGGRSGAIPAMTAMLSPTAAGRAQQLQAEEQLPVTLQLRETQTDVYFSLRGLTVAMVRPSHPILTSAADPGWLLDGRDADVTSGIYGLLRALCSQDSKEKAKVEARNAHYVSLAELKQYKDRCVRAWVGGRVGGWAREG